MVVEFETERSLTVAKSGIIALMYWLDLQGREIIPPEFGQMALYRAGNYVSDPELLLNCSVAACERRWNKSPVLSGSAEEKAIQFLQWLKEYGDITSLTIE